jgi:hypothetical protein
MLAYFAYYNIITITQVRYFTLKSFSRRDTQNWKQDTGLRTSLNMREKHQTTCKILTYYIVICN